MSRQGISHGLGSGLRNYKEAEREDLPTRTPLPCKGPLWSLRGWRGGGGSGVPAPGSMAVGLRAGICMEGSVVLEFMQPPVWFLRRDESPGRFSQREQAFSSNQW